jgi:sulfatase maturation enzyme AslB (radical SAM superfamily)
MTTTAGSLDQPEAIVDEYVRLGFDSIFLRWLSPFGFATKTQRSLGYSTAAWCEFYERGLRHVLKLNEAGVQIREELASIVLRKMLTPFATGYVDLQNPSGLGISVVAYNYDGGVYASDEGRMLAETGDQTFRLGSVHDSYAALFGSDRLVDILSSTMTEAIPGCHECAFEPFCGTDPVLHHATQGDIVGHRPTSAFCSRNMFVFRLLIRLLEDDPRSRRILESWAAA